MLRRSLREKICHSVLLSGSIGTMFKAYYLLVLAWREEYILLLSVCSFEFIAAILFIINCCITNSYTTTNLVFTEGNDNP